MTTPEEKGDQTGEGEKACTKTLQAILSYQDKAKVKYPEALAEIQKGRKRKHWIWYVFPCWNKIRRTKLPECELPNLETAMAYLMNKTLRSRLVEISAAAAKSLSKSIEKSINEGEVTDKKEIATIRRKSLIRMFGGIDSVKFKETMTFFLIAARENELVGKESDEMKKAATIFAEGLNVATNGKLHPRTIEVLSIARPQYKAASVVPDLWSNDAFTVLPKQ